EKISSSPHRGLRGRGRYGLSEQHPLLFARKTMTRATQVLMAMIVLACCGDARAQGLDMRDIMGGGPNFFQNGSGVSPIPRTTINYSTQYAPGTIVVNTAERRLYLVLDNGQALRYGIGVGRDGFRWSGTHRITAKKEWTSWTPPRQMLA